MLSVIEGNRGLIKDVYQQVSGAQASFWTCRVGLKVLIRFHSVACPGQIGLRTQLLFGSVDETEEE